ncbi:MAG: peptidase M28 family protein [Ideonella sp. MAG2]|nr:MAG: peptidase M28 family protein [Ideonella sp. MAG2]
MSITRRHLALASLGGLGLRPQLSTAQHLNSAALSPQDLRHAQALRELGLKDSLAYALTESLVTEVGARPAGSPADARAVAWAQAQMQRLGLSQVRAEPVSMKVWQRGPLNVMLSSPVPHPLTALALGNSISTAPEGLDAEVAYYPDLAALKADHSERPKGRIVFVDQRMSRSRDGSGYGLAVMARIGGAVEAARRGAVAVVIRSIGTDRDRLAHTGAMRYDQQVAMIPALAVSVPDAELIARLHQRSLQPDGQPLRMRLNMRNVSHVEATSHNVLGEIPGTDLAQEVVMLSAHLDSWDVGQGAVDDGAGVGIVLAAAKTLLQGGQRPRRTVRVVLFANEENGFDGALAYGEAHVREVHQMLSESDFGAGQPWRLRSRVREEALPVIQTLAELLAPLGIARPDTQANQGSPGPDAAFLMRKYGWPGLELTQDGTRYFDGHHTENDTLEQVDPATLPVNVAAWATTAWVAAQSPVGWGPIAV